MKCNATKVERVVVLVFAAIENFFHSSILFGWPSLVYVLKDLGYYSNLCPPSDNNDTTAVSTSPSTSFQISPSMLITTESGDMVDEDVAECDSQDARLLLIYTISSSLIPCSMLFSGILFERGGTLVTRITFSISLFIAYMCIATSSPSVPDLLFPGTIIMGVAGIFIIISAFEVSNLFAKYKSTVIGLLVGSCDSSACVLLLIKVLYDAGISMHASFYALAISTLFFSVNTVLLPRTHIPWPLPDNYRLDRGCCTKNQDQNSDSPLHQNSDNPIDLSTIEAYETNKNKYDYVTGDTMHFDDPMSSGYYTNLDENGIVNNQSCPDNNVAFEREEISSVTSREAEKTNGLILANGTKYCEKKGGRVVFHDNAGYEHEYDQAQDGNLSDIPKNPIACQEVELGADIQLSKEARRATMDKLTEDQRLEDFPTTWSILKSPMFLLMTFWTIAVQGEIFFVIGIMNPWLTWLADGDTEAVSLYTNIFAVTTIGSLFGSPVMGYVFDGRKQLHEKSSQKDNAKGPYAELRDSWLPVAISTCTAILMTGLMMIPILPVQFGTFILLTAVRSMFYSASAAIVPITFPMRFYPTVFGTANFIAGVCSLTQYPLFIVIQDILDGDPRWVLFGFMVANVIALIYPLYIYVYGNNHENLYMETKRLENPTNGVAA